VRLLCDDAAAICTLLWLSALAGARANTTPRAHAGDLKVSESELLGLLRVVTAAFSRPEASA
jgi:hypothetical protein